MKNKKIAAALIAALGAMTVGGLAACGGDDKPQKKPSEPIKLATPVLAVNDNVVSWQAIDHASGYVVRVDDNEAVTVQTTSYTITQTEPAVYTIYVKAVSSDDGYKDSAEASIKYEIVKPVPQDLMLVKNPDKTSYFLDETAAGEELDTTGLAVQLKYNNGNYVDVKPTVGSVDLTAVGDKTVELSYETEGTVFKTSFVVTVRERTEFDIGDSLVKKTYEYDKTAAEHKYELADGEVTAVDMKGKQVTVAHEGGKSYVAFDGAKSMLLKVKSGDDVSFVKVCAAHYVRTEADFMNINSDLSASYVLANDIVLEGEKSVMIGAAPVKAATGYDDERAYTFDKEGYASWTYPETSNPVPDGEPGGAPFTGTFDGNGYVVSGYSRDVGSYWKAEANYMGLFAYICEGGVVENFTIRNTTIKGGKLCGVIAGVNLGTIKNVVVEDDCTLHSQYNGGGLIGYNGGKVANVVSYVSRGESGYGGFDISGAAYESGADATAQNVYVGNSGDLTATLGAGWFFVDGIGTVYGNDSYKKVLSMPTVMYESASNDITAQISLYQKTDGEIEFVTWIGGVAQEGLISYVGYDAQTLTYTVKLNVTDLLAAGDKFDLGVKSLSTQLFIGAIETVTVGEPYAVSAEYNGEPLTVMQNTNMVLDSISLEVAYSDGTTQSLHPTKLEGFDNTAAVGDKQNVKLFYGDGAEQYVEVEVTITEVTGVVATTVTATEKTAGQKIVIAEGAQFDIFEYYTITVEYSDGSNKTVEKGDAGLSVGAVKSGLNNISVNYTDGAAVSTVIQNVAVWQEISTVAGFDAMNDNLAGYYVLANDLDFAYTPHKISSIVTAVAGGDTVIDTTAAETTAFTGKFDGGGHTISGWRTAYETGWNADFFGYSMFAFIGTGGDVGNFTLSNFVASACNYHSFVATLNKGRIHDVTIDDTCSIRCNWGAAAAFAAINNGTVENSSCAVTTFTQLGGKYEGDDGVTTPDLKGVFEGNQPQ